VPSLSADRRILVGQLGGGATARNVQVLPFDARFARACEKLVAALPEWFGLPDSNAAYLRNLSVLPSWVALHGSEVVGAISLEQHFPASFEVHFMAVHPDHHRTGVGRVLLDRLECEARSRGGRWLQVKTLAPSHPDPFYARTRLFYEAMGFSPLFESSELWGPENPALVLVKAL
jgi:GNAT superfamily N-acetyltransferase